MERKVLYIQSPKIKVESLYNMMDRLAPLYSINIVGKTTIYRKGTILKLYRQRQPRDIRTMILCTKLTNDNPTLHVYRADTGSYDMT